MTIGGGVRKSLSPSLKVKPSEKAYQPSFKSDVGLFAAVKVGGEHTSLVLKYVVEGFKSPELGEINGNHFGIYLEFAQ